jgi:ureidoacrylate peracid hydrolase
VQTIDGIEVPMTVEELLPADRSAVLVLAMQNELVSEQGGLAQSGADVSEIRAIIPGVRQILDAARRVGALSAYVEHIQRNRLGTILAIGPDYFAFRDANWAPCIQDGAWAAQTIEELAPRPGDVLVVTPRASAFAGTSLDASLRAKGIQSLVVVGTGLGGAMVQTYYEAQQRGYYPLVVADAVAPTEPDRSLLPELTGMAPRLTTRDILNVWRGAHAVDRNHL